MTIPTLEVFVLDKSSSMAHVRDTTISAFNEFLEDQKRAEGDAFLTLILFSTLFDALNVATPIFAVEPLTPKTYSPCGGTALFDAVGFAIKQSEKWVKENKFTGQVKVIILTDGEENSSRSWHIKNPIIAGDNKDLGGLIQWKQAEGWEFIFMGSGGKDWLERTFSHVVPIQAIFDYQGDAGSTRSTYAGASQAMSQSRADGQSFAASFADLKEQEKDSK